MTRLAHLLLTAFAGLLAVAMLPRASSAPVPAQAGKPLPPELVLIPHDAAAVYTARTRAALAALPPGRAEEPMDPDAWIACVYVGVAPEDVERFTVIVPPGPLPQPPKDDGSKRPVVTPDPVSVEDVPPEVRYKTLVLTTRRPLARLPYQVPNGSLGRGACRTGRTATHRGHTFALDDDGWTAWLKVGDRTVVYGTRASVEWVIDQIAGHAKSGPLGPAIQAIRDSDIASITRPSVEVTTRSADLLTLTSDTTGRTVAKGVEAWIERLGKEPAPAPDAIATGADLASGRLELCAVYPTEKVAARRAGDFRVLRTDIAEIATAVRAEPLAPDADEEKKRDAARLKALPGLLNPLDNPTVTGRLVSVSLPGLASALLGDAENLRPMLRIAHGPPLFSSTIGFDPSIDRETYREVQVLRALEAYHARHGRYPDAAVVGKDGKPLLSWRVTLLPYLGFEDLYKKFKLDESWDSPHNTKLLEQIPWPYSDGDSRRFRHRPVTRLHLPVGPGTMFEDGKGRKKADATDGADQTVLLLKSDRPVPWTKPQDAVVAAGKPLKVGGEAARLCGFCTVDGKARSLDQFALLGGEFDAAALLTRAGGEPKMDIDKAIAAAALAAGHDNLDYVGIFERVFKQGGIDIPKGLPRPPVMPQP